MSFGDQPVLSSLQKLGCAIYAIVSGFTALYLMFAAALGDCASDADCFNETTRALMFYGSPFLALFGGVMLSNYFIRDED